MLRQKEPSIQEMVALVKAAAAEAAEYQERFAAEDTESRKIVDIMERFLRVKSRVIYGGAAINAHLSAENKFYDPAVNLPDYDFMTPDPLQDCADLIVTFQHEGFKEVEAKFGIHEGTYKIFVNFRAAADITYMPPEIFERVVEDSALIDGLRYASVNFLRMNMYLELSRPLGDLKRWEKVFERLILLNEEYPLKAGRCAANPLEALAISDSESEDSLHDQIVEIGIAGKSVFLSGAATILKKQPRTDEVVLMISDKPAELVGEIKEALGLRSKYFEAMGELLPSRTELRTQRRHLVAVVFDTVACHSYVEMPRPKGYRLGSLDLLIQMYYAMYFVDLKGYLPVRLLCLIQELIELNASSRKTKALEDSIGESAHDVFPLDCVGHQPTMPELKRAHRARVRDKRKELAGIVRMESSVRPRSRRSLSKAKAAKSKE